MTVAVNAGAMEEERKKIGKLLFPDLLQQQGGSQRPHSELNELASTDTLELEGACRGPEDGSLHNISSNTLRGAAKGATAGAYKCKQ